MQSHLWLHCLLAPQLTTCLKEIGKLSSGMQFIHSKNENFAWSSCMISQIRTHCKDTWMHFFCIRLQGHLLQLFNLQTIMTAALKDNAGLANLLHWEDSSLYCFLYSHENATRNLTCCYMFLITIYIQHYRGDTMGHKE